MASLSYDIKKILFERLENVRQINFALQFCTVLIEAQDLLEKCEDKEEYMCHKQEHFLRDIRRIIDKVPAVELVDTIFKTLLELEKEAYEQLLQRLVFLLKFECEIRIAELIECVESLMNLALRTGILIDWYYHGNCMENERKLVTLKNFMLIFGKKRAQEFFNTLYRLCTSELEFKRDEKKKVRDVVVETLPYCQELFIDSCYNNNELGITQLKLRSKLQFIRDLLAEYSDQDRALEDFIKSLDSFLVRFDAVAKWSETLLKTCLINDSNGPYYYITDDLCSQTIERFYEAGGAKVPKEHTWWEEFRKVNF